MLSLQPNKQQAPKTTPNLLPCAINHSGPISTSQRYWSPTADADGSSTAYFRGRKLRGRRVRLPAGYQGVVLQKTDRLLPSTTEQRGGGMAEQLRRMEEDDGEDEMDFGEPLEKEGEVKVVETKAVFDEVVVWSHEMVPAAEDEYVRGIEEWIGLAEAMHSHNTPTK